MLGMALMPEQASLRSGVPPGSPLEGYLLFDLALITPGLARRYQWSKINFMFILLH